MRIMKMEPLLKEYIKERYSKKYDINTFSKYFKEYEGIKEFAPNGNINNEISNEAHFIMRIATQFYIEQAFKAMKIDLNDENVKEDLEHENIGTAGRIAKVWCGANTNDDRELGSGRWSKKPRLAKFPNTSQDKIPITKKVDLVSNCSHHFITFSSLTREDSYAVISYIPDKFVLGISKLQRLTDWVSQRFWLQEDLTKALYDEVSKIAQTKSVYVGLFNIVHGCESFRGAKTKEGSFTSEYYGGEFKDSELRKQVKNV